MHVKRSEPLLEVGTGSSLTASYTRLRSDGMDSGDLGFDSSDDSDSDTEPPERKESIAQAVEGTAPGGPILRRGGR